MTRIMPTSTLAAKEAARNNANQQKPLSLLGQKQALQTSENDPLLRGRQKVFNDVLQQREAPVQTASETDKGLLYSIGLEDEAIALKNKAYSLLVQLGLKETGKTHAMRRMVSHETRQAIVAPEEHRLALPSDAENSPLVAEARQAVSRSGSKGRDNNQNQPANQPANQATASQSTPEQALGGAYDAEALAAAAPDLDITATGVASTAATAAESADAPAVGSILAEGSYGLRMPVNTRLRNSVAIDLVAEKKAREMLTAEAKEALLPVTGELSAVFESGKDGIAAIGYDRRGGTSYGKYQIASRVGSMKRFLSFLNDKAPEWADRLRNAGPSNTRSRWGGMPSEWKKIAAEDPERFELLQDQFILATNYQPAADGIKARANLDVAELSPAIREVLWSTAVQHGARGASNIFARAAKVAQGKEGQDFDKAMIEEVYRVRKFDFSSSSSRVRRAVHSRLNSEKNMALELLADGSA